MLFCYFKKTNSEDIETILQLQADVFEGEQKIPSALIPLPNEKSPQWCCAFIGTAMVGAVAHGKKIIKYTGADLPQNRTTEDSVSVQN